MKRKDVGLCFQSVRLASDEPFGAYTGICGARSPFYARSGSKRRLIHQHSLSRINEGFCRTSDDLALLDNVAFHHFPSLWSFLPMQSG